MLEGICPRCGLHHQGRALNRRRNRMCLKCGSPLEVRKGSARVTTLIESGPVGYSISSEPDHWEQMRQKVTSFMSRN